MKTMCQPENISLKYIDPIEVALETKLHNDNTNTRDGDLGNNDSIGNRASSKDDLAKEEDNTHLKLDDRQVATFKDFYLYIDQVFCNLPERVSIRNDHLSKVMSLIIEGDFTEEVNVFEDVGYVESAKAQTR